MCLRIRELQDPLMHFQGLEIDVFSTGCSMRLVCCEWVHFLLFAGNVQRGKGWLMSCKRGMVMGADGK
jgi:hypothetical protein